MLNQSWEQGVLLIDADGVDIHLERCDLLVEAHRARTHNAMGLASDIMRHVEVLDAVDSILLNLQKAAA